MGVSQGLSLRDVPEGGHNDTRLRPVATTAPAVTAVIPTLNEAGNIGWVLRRLPPVVDEVIVVDGLSTDGTIGAALAARPDVVVVRSEQRGKGVALQAGFAAARGDIIVMLDADCSMDPAEIDRLVAALRPDVDLVKGSRFMPGAGTSDITPLRRWGNGALLALVNHLYGARFTDLCYGFIAFRRSALQGLRIDAPGFEVETQIAVHALLANMRIEEAPSFEYARHAGVSKLHPCRDGTRVLWTIAREHRGMRRAARARARGTVTLSPPSGVLSLTAGGHDAGE
jgi:glycosyltransferase involved in cell wall biosynthesis